MKKDILVIDGDPTTEKVLSDMLANQPYRIVFAKTLAECEGYMQDHAVYALIFDLDTVAIDNRSISSLKQKYPEVGILAKSGRTFHPELEEFIRRFIFACLTKPLDQGELIFWLKSISLASERG